MAALLSIVSLVCFLAAFVCGIIILIAAFQDEVIQGLLCLCVPFYVLYYAFARFESDNKWLIIGIWLGAAIVGNVLQFAAAAMLAG